MRTILFTLAVVAAVSLSAQQASAGQREHHGSPVGHGASLQLAAHGIHHHGHPGHHRSHHYRHGYGVRGPVVVYPPAYVHPPVYAHPPVYRYRTYYPPCHRSYGYSQGGLQIYTGRVGFSIAF